MEDFLLAAMDTQNQYFRGYAYVEIRNLRLDSTKYIDKRKISRIIKSFRRSGCENRDAKQSVPMLIDQARLDVALLEANLTPEAFQHGRCPKLRFQRAESFAILYGDHRLLAARKHLPADDNCWTVALYDQGIYRSRHLSVQS